MRQNVSVSQHTVHLDDDLAEQVRTFAAETDHSFNWGVKELIKLGLAADSVRGVLVTPPPKGPSWQEKVADALDKAEGDLDTTQKSLSAEPVKALLREQVYPMPKGGK